MCKKLSIIIVIMLLLASPSLANAESVIWSKTLGNFNMKLYLFGFTLNNPMYSPNVQIEYKTRVYNASTSKVIPCGSTVPAGTTLAYQFFPHSYTDISWFGTGRVQDSPYGDWISGAGRGRWGACHTKNIISTKVKKNGRWVTAKKSDRIAMLVNFSVNPPRRSISGLPGNQCRKSSNGDYTCRFTQAGKVNAQYNFGATYGKFWGGLMMGNGCAEGTAYGHEPMKSGSKSKVTVPAKTIKCPITVLAPPVGRAPNRPVVDASCVVGQPSVVTATATHPDAASADTDIRYLFDWNTDGKTDQVLPATGYVPAGTSVSATHVWSSKGHQIYKVAAEDRNGLISPRKTGLVNCIEDPDYVPPSGTIEGTDPVGGILHVSEEEAEEVPLTPEERRQRNKFSGLFPDGKVVFNLDPKITNTTCKATWDAYAVESCSLFKNNTKTDDIDVFGEDDVSPGTYKISCSRISDGVSVEATQSCTRNIEFREI